MRKNSVSLSSTTTTLENKPLHLNFYILFHYLSKSKYLLDTKTWFNNRLRIYFLHIQNNHCFSMHHVVGETCRKLPYTFSKGERICPDNILLNIVLQAFVWSERIVLISFIRSELQITRYRLRQTSLITGKYMRYHTLNTVYGTSLQFPVSQSRYVMSAKQPINLHKNLSNASCFLSYLSTQLHKIKVRIVTLNSRRAEGPWFPKFFYHLSDGVDAHWICPCIL